jgi:hypothetical protein
VNSYFVLPVLAAQEMPHEREISCRSAAGEPDIDADCSEDERSNSQFAERLCGNSVECSAEDLFYIHRDLGAKPSTRLF